MQLFIIPNSLISHFEHKSLHTAKGADSIRKIVISNISDILHQMRKVLRMKKGDTFQLQSEIGNIRYELEIHDRDDQNLTGIIKNTFTKPSFPTPKTTILIAMPNKREKAELIVQKLSEIGVDKIIFRPAQRSVIKQWNEKKSQRLTKISREAVEQSRGWNLPDITFISDLSLLDNILCETIHKQQIIVFDKIDGHQQELSLNKAGTGILFDTQKEGIVGVIGPEGGLSESDYQLFSAYQVISLGDTVLRMETAAIIGAWYLKTIS